MVIKNRLFPYPVLCEENDDYTDSTFLVKCEYKVEAFEIVLQFNIQLENNEELERNIRDGYAEYVIHLECSPTGFRKVIKTAGNQIEYRIPMSRVNHEIALVGMIVAAKVIPSFTSKHLNEDYADEPIRFSKGSILAYCNMPKLSIIKRHEQLAKDKAIFSIVKRTMTDPDEHHAISYLIDDDKIKIVVDEDIFNQYSLYRDNPDMEALNRALLIMPALIHTLEALHNCDDSDSEYYKSKDWYIRIKKSCAAQGFNFEDELQSEKSDVEIAQQLLQLPINGAFQSLSDIINAEDD